ncbi:hypothetical protein HRbin24_00076 [bacterium HR24]|nr:hypothetical protein HRbin24_00076 [bacterium HR24]
MEIAYLDILSPYEAFQHYGLDDGDHPLASMVMEAVLGCLAELGYDAEQAMSIHNHAIYLLRRRTDGQQVDLGRVAEEHGIDLEESPEAVRQALLAAGLTDVVEALDKLDQERLWLGRLPAVVIVRHPNRGDVQDLHLFASPQAAARFALQHEGEDLEVVVPVHEEGQGHTRYRQLLWDEELEGLAGSSE